MSSNYINDYYPPLIIDIGTANVKYSQPILNTCKLTREVIKTNDKEEDIINANTIFDYKNCIKSVPITNYLNKIDNIKDKEIIDFDFSKSKNRKWSHEPVYSGKIYSFDKWKYIVESIGKSIYEGNKNYFDQELYSETPLIITQDSLPLIDIEKQVQQIYEICFEELKCQNVLICSSAMVNLYSHNISSGLVIDIGESRTCITPIKNGFACYDRAVRSEFFSGRTMTAMMAQMDQDYKNNDSKELMTEVMYKNYSISEETKTKKHFCCPEDISSYDHKYCHLSYLFTFPEIFRSLYWDSVRTTHDFIKSFIYCNKSNNDHNPKFNEREEIKAYFATERNKKAGNRTIKTLKFTEWTNSINKHYSLNNTNGLIEQIRQSEIGLINKEELVKFRHYSLSHLLYYQIEQLIYEDSDFRNFDIVFAGGVLNTPNLKNVLKKDLESLTNSADNAMSIHFPDINDASCSFYKGANYLSKLGNLSSLMVSRQEFYEVGKECLGYNYI